MPADHAARLKGSSVDSEVAGAADSYHLHHVDALAAMFSDVSFFKLKSDHLRERSQRRTRARTGMPGVGDGAPSRRFRMRKQVTVVGSSRRRMSGRLLLWAPWWRPFAQQMRTTLRQ